MHVYKMQLAQHYITVSPTLRWHINIAGDVFLAGSFAPLANAVWVLYGWKAGHWRETHVGRDASPYVVLMARECSQSSVLMKQTVYAAHLYVLNPERVFCRDPDGRGRLRGGHAARRAANVCKCDESVATELTDIEWAGRPTEWPRASFSLTTRDVPHFVPSTPTWINCKWLISKLHNKMSLKQFGLFLEV